MTIIVKNQTASEIALPDLGNCKVPASGQFELTRVSTISEIYNSSDLITRIDAGDIVLNDGVADLSLADSKEFIQPFNTRNPVKKTSFKSPNDTDWELSVDDAGILTTEQAV